tara:strand:+ start:48 stop:293 length:246 start_codon:yes stop_codon:yes gene_type:complete
MKHFIIPAIIFFHQFATASDCYDFQSYMSNAESYASDAYSYARKAYRNMDDIDYAERYIKKAYRAASDAESEASSYFYYCD